MKLLTALHATVTCLSAFLLFLLEPLVARQLLPLFGGSAAVWVTCLVFFQCALLAGYLYAHLVVMYLRPRSQALVHVALLILAVLSLEFRVHPGRGALTWHPVLTLLWLLTATAGMPFLALAATSPLLQAWFTNSPIAARPPWWLFALSNAGSLLALFLYPVVLEPNLALHAQFLVWAAGFSLFVALCGALALHQRRARAACATLPASVPGRSPRLLWVFLPACSSMLLCAVTNHLGENIAAIPLLWVLPLAAYLLSFVVAFASERAWPRFLSVRMLALTLAVFAYLLYTSRTALPLQISIPVYIAALFFACLFCHSELYRLRPAGGDLTSYYLLLAAGSALGAILVGIAAPNLFHANHDLAIAALLLAVSALASTWRVGWIARAVWASAAVALLYIATIQSSILGEDALVELRGFYGSLRVTETHLPPEAETTRTLYHGRIQHGTQLFGNGLRTLPASYYGHESGVGLALDFCCADRPRRIAVIGLGAGTIAAYGKPGDSLTFYEIDPLVERLARALFTYLRDSRAAPRVVLGDARLSLAREPDSSLHDVLVLDAFSGDAVPVHLLTAQAIALYQRHLRPGGVLVFHISSQYLDLAPQLSLQAQHAGLHAVLVHSDASEPRGLFAADWVLMTADRSLLSLPPIANLSQPLPEGSRQRLWTDDYSSLLPLLKWHAGRKGEAGR